MKLIIQIPCLNEEETLPVTLADLPRSIDGIDVIEWLVIDDGSTDATVDKALAHGVDHVVRLPYNQGLASAFMAGLDACLRNGADIIVNTDADNQYNAQDIETLVRPILEGKADYVIGARQISSIGHFSPIKKSLQKLGSFTVRYLSGLQIPDAPSGFRAISRNAAYKLNVFNKYTYTLETLIQAGNSNIKTISVPIRVNGETRPSRLFKNIRGYVSRSMKTIIHFFFIYRAFNILLFLSSVLFLSGFMLGVRFLYLNVYLQQGSHVQSLLLAVLLMVMGFVAGLSGYIADLVSINRRLLEQVKELSMKIEHRINRQD